MPRQRSRSPLSPILATESATVRLFFILSVLLCSVNKAGLKTETWLLYCLRLRSRSPHNAKHSTSYIYIHVCTYVCTYAMHCGIVLSAIDSSTLNSSAMDLSAMDSSAIGVGVAVLVGKCMQGPCSAVPDSIR